MYACHQVYPMALSKEELGHSKRYRSKRYEGCIYVHKYMHKYKFVSNYIYSVLSQTFHCYILSCGLSW